MDSNERAELQKEAQTKIKEARKLIQEAGKLAKKGQFVLHFGEIGTFIPKRYKDHNLYRDEAVKILKKDGYSWWDDKTASTKVTPYKEIAVDQMESAITETIESIIEDLNIPYEYHEYVSGDEGTDSWWRPSRC